MKRLLPIAISTSIALLLTGCLKNESEIGQSQYSDIDMNTGSKITSSDERSTTRVQFDPENQVIPFPNNLMFEAGWEPEFDDYGNYPAHDGTLKVPLPKKANGEVDTKDSSDKIKARQARLDVALAKKANHIIPDADNQDETFVGADIHPEMQRQVASFLSNQGKAITDVDLEKIR